MQFKLEFGDVDFKISITLKGDFRDEIKLFDYTAFYNTYLSIPKVNANDYNISAFSDGIIFEGVPQNIEKLYESEKTPYYYALRLREAVSEKISLFMQTNQGGLLKGILFGDTNDINYETSNAFRTSGISHLLAVSGMHTSLYCGILIAVLSSFNIPEKLRNFACLIFLVFFCIISSFTPSVIRASLMMAVILVAPFFKRNPDSINSLGFSVVLMLLNNPYVLLSVGFQLSVAATLGVLFSVQYNKTIYKFTEKIKENHIKKILTSILLSLSVSIFAALFTMPISAYYFGVFGLLSPITNILTVQLSFFATVLGIIATCFSFINIHFTKEIAIFLFKITQFLIDLIIEAAKFISSFKLCTIPMHKDFLIPGIITGALVLLIGYIIFKLRKNRLFFKICTFLCIFAVFFSCALPILPTKYKTQLSVLYSAGGIRFVIRNGLDYAYIENTDENIGGEDYDYLPIATCEVLKLYIPTYLNSLSLYNPSIITERYSPEKTVVSKSVLNELKESKCAIPENAVIKHSGIFTLSEEITIEIVDTTTMKYAIIKGNENTVYIHLYGDTDFSLHLDTSQCDIVVFNSTIPEKIPQGAKTVILSGKLSKNEFNKKFPEYKGELFITALSGNISFYI